MKSLTDAKIQVKQSYYYFYFCLWRRSTGWRPDDRPHFAILESKVQQHQVSWLQLVSEFTPPPTPDSSFRRKQIKEK